MLSDLGVAARAVASDAELAGVRVLIFGRRALAKSPFRLERLIAEGKLNVLVLEQDSQTLERLGFRVQEYGVRRAFRADGTRLCDARGASTLCPPYLDTEGLSKAVHAFGEHENACTWRAGTRGTVASVLIEKPDVGDFCPLVSAGFDLQYAPVLAYRFGRGEVIFSQLDVCGRTELDPQLAEEVRRLLERLVRGTSADRRKIVHAGGTLGVATLRDRQFAFDRLAPSAPLPEQGLLVVTPGARIVEPLLSRVEGGLDVVAVGLSGRELERLFPGVCPVQTGDWTFDGQVPAEGPFGGLTAADLHWRGKVSGELFASGPGVASAVRSFRRGRGQVVVLQTAPWTFDEEERSLRTTVRRQSFLFSRVLHNLGALSQDAFVNVFNASFRNGRRLRLDKGWSARLAGTEAWHPIRVPGVFEKQLPGAARYDGKVEYRLRFDVPAYMLLAKSVNLYLGPVDDESWTAVNGCSVGEITRQTNPDDYWCKPRFHRLSPALLRLGTNELTVTVNDVKGEGGLMGVPNMSVPEVLSLYTDNPIENDDPYRYYSW